ncbi:MAG: hypothetical protein DRQ10_03580 [Candidatus Hydrothermota bacterium]|nr:MAG: hypothetical protein DRQ10_03580 [Candidatus Hydrothermae bacterium]
MKSLRWLLVIAAVGVLSADTWVQATKAHFKTGTLNGVQATLPSGEDDGYLRLAIPVYNGYFDETDDHFDGWSDESSGDGTHIVEVVDGGGRTSVLHLRATYGTQSTYARATYMIVDGLESLRRFNFELYPISSEISYDGRVLLIVFAYDDQDNSLIQGGWMTYLIGGSYTIRDYDWRSQTVSDRWNIYRFDLKSHIEGHLAVGYTWSDVAKVKIMFSVEAPGPGDDAYGVYIDAVWAASFIDDNFDDNSVNTSKWSIYQNIYHVDEQNQMVRFWGYDNSDTHWSSLDRDQYTVGTASCEAAALMRHQYMEDENGQEFELGFYSLTSDKYLILRAHRDGTNGHYYVAYYDGSNWNTTQIGTYYFLNMANFYTWRIIYDADNDRFEAWVNGKMVGRVEGFVMEDYYPYIAATDDDNDPNDSIDCQTDDFMFFDFSQGSWDKRYVPSGEYISAPYDLGFAAEFLKFKWAADVPTGTEVKFQFRSGWTLSELQNAEWRGPNGPGTYFTTSGQEFDQFHDGHRWFQVKAILSTTDSLVTPKVDSIIVEFNQMASIEADSDEVELSGDISSVVHYDASGNRVLTAYFYDLSGFGTNAPRFSGAVHHEPHPRLSGGIDKWWRVSLDGSFSEVDLVFHYLDSDIPDGIDEGTMVAWRYDGSWSSTGPSELNTTDNFFRKNGLTSLSEWTLGDPGATGVVENEDATPPRPLPTVKLLNDGEAVGVILNLPKPSRCQFKIYDVSGRTVGQPQSVMLSEGKHFVPLSRMPHSGIFFLEVAVEDRIFVRKIFVMQKGK